MSLSLYRKYRPETFDQVLGQDHIVTALKSAIASGTISHAYLFAGSRGTGKTSIARIFARELGTSPSDIYEIDAASNNGVDEIRELRDGVSTLPFDSKYKVYILDEVHMLSKAAFNALLKTLEEPPAHVIFILATTELHKVLDTVKSRCQLFEFKKPTIEILHDMIIQGGKKEGVTIEPEAADLIAKRGDGAYRDTWGIVERILASSTNKTITPSDVERILATPHQEIVLEFIASIISGNLSGAIGLVNQITNQGHAVDDFLEQVIEICRLIILYRFAPELAEDLASTMNPDRIVTIKQWSSEKNRINSDFLADMLRLLGETKKTSMPIIPVELALIRILAQ